MAEYLITAPDGKQYRVSGDGTQDEAFAHFQKQYNESQRQQRIAAIVAANPSDYMFTPEGMAKNGPAASGSTLSNMAAGAGKFLFDTSRGVRQLGANVADSFSPTSSLSDLVTGQDNSRSGRIKAEADDYKRLSAPLMATKAGKVGNVLGGAVFSAPAMLIPGANTLAGATLIGAGTGALQPVGTGDSRTANMAFGGAGGALGYGAGQLFNKLAGSLRSPGGFVRNDANVAADLSTTPGVASADAAVTGSANVTGRGGYNYGSVGPDPSAGITEPAKEILAAGSQLGMRTTPGQATGSKALQMMEAKLASQPMAGGRFAAIDANNTKILNRVAAKAIGETSDTLDSGTIDKAFRRLGSVFDDAGDSAARQINPDEFVQRLSGIESESQGLLAGNKSVVDHPLVRDLYSLASKGEATGEQLANMSSKLGKAVNSNMTGASGDRQLGIALGEVKDLTDDLLAQGMTGQRLDKLMQARGQYRTLLTLVKNQGVVDPTTGNVKGTTLANVLNRGDRMGFVRGNNNSDLYTAARFSRAFRDTIGNSGTATRMPLNSFEMAASIPLNLAARAYTAGPSINAALRAQAVSKAVAPAVQPFMRPLSPYLQYGLPGAGGLLGTYAAQ